MSLNVGKNAITKVKDKRLFSNSLRIYINVIFVSELHTSIDVRKILLKQKLKFRDY